jgi:hypothetical protein
VRGTHWATVSDAAVAAGAAAGAGAAAAGIAESGWYQLQWIRMLVFADDEPYNDVFPGLVKKYITLAASLSLN